LQDYKWPKTADLKACSTPKDIPWSETSGSARAGRPVCSWQKKRAPKCSHFRTQKYTLNHSFQQHFHQFFDVEVIPCLWNVGSALATNMRTQLASVNQLATRTPLTHNTHNWSLKMGEAQVMGQNDLGHTVTWMIWGMTSRKPKHFVPMFPCSKSQSTCRACMKYFGCASTRAWPLSTLPLDLCYQEYYIPKNILYQVCLRYDRCVTDLTDGQNLQTLQQILRWTPHPKSCRFRARVSNSDVEGFMGFMLSSIGANAPQFTLTSATVNPHPTVSFATWKHLHGWFVESVSSQPQIDIVQSG
jgi:hypothetical protein